MLIEPVDLETSRCVLLILNTIDYENVKRLYMNEAVRKYLGGTLLEISFEMKLKEMLYSKSANYWCVYLKDTKEFIGLVFLERCQNPQEVEVGYQFLPDYWGKNLATEVIKRLLDFSFNQLCFEKIIAETQVLNQKSCHLLNKLGFQREESLERYGNLQYRFALYKEKYISLMFKRLSSN